MSYLIYLIGGIFLPIFPFSMLFNLLYARISHPVVKGLLLLIWPQMGLLLLFGAALTATKLLVVWALLTSLLYAFRAIALRDLGLWTSFVATSSWSLLWILYADSVGASVLQIISLSISIPLVLMALLGAGLERRFGAAYLGLYGGLAQSIPRFAGVLVLVVLAVVATPLFPAFFIMLSMIIKSIAITPVVAMGVGIVWLLWSWAGTKLLHGLIAGPQVNAVVDLSRSKMWIYIAVLVSLVLTGVYWLGAML